MWRVVERFVRRKGVINGGEGVGNTVESVENG